MDDRELLDRYCRDGEQGAFAELVRRHGDWIYSSARRQLRDAHLAEDVTQAVFLLLARKAAGITARPNLGGWLFGTLRYCIKEARRRRSRQLQREQEAAQMRQDVAPEATWEQVSPILDDAIARLGRSDREAILLRFYQCKPLADVGQALGTSEEAARKRVDRAVEKLREKLAAKGVEAQALSLSALVLAHAVEAGPVGLMERIRASVGPGVGSSAAGGIAQGAAKMMVWAKVKMVAAIIVVIAMPCVLAARLSAAARIEGGDEVKKVIAAVEAASARIETIRAHMLITGELDSPGKPKVTAVREVQWVSRAQRSHTTTKMRQMVDGKEPPPFDINRPSSLYPALDTDTARSGDIELTFFPGQSRAERRTPLPVDRIPMDDAARDVRFFGFTINGMALSELLAGKPEVAGEPEFPADHIVKWGGKAMYEGREVDTILAEVHWGGGKRASYTKVYVDPERGYTIPYYETDFEIGGKRQRGITVTTECGNSGGVWAPRRTVVTKLVSGEGGDGTYRLTRELTDVVINAPVSDGELRVALPEGCRVFDHIANVDYIYDGSRRDVLDGTGQSLAERIPRQR